MRHKKQEPGYGQNLFGNFYKGHLLGSSARLVLAFALGGLVFGSQSAFALDAKATPQGGKVVGGSASFKSSSGSLTVTQKTNRAVIDWSSFNIGKDAQTVFKQPNANAIAVNRVTGGASPTQILGTLKSNGKLMILDQNGVLFGSSAKVDVGGLIASTGTINTQNFMVGSKNLGLSNLGTGKVENQGTITAKQGGLVAFVAPEVINSGTITARLGRIEMAAGSAATLDLYGDQIISVAVSDTTLKAIVDNSGVLRADGGSVTLTAKAARTAVDSVINMSGTISADTIGKNNGKIVLSAGDGRANVSGEMSAASLLSSGGSVIITGDNIALNGADIDVSGRSGGGQILIGGDLNGSDARGIQRSSVTTVSADSVVRADATKKGNGGLIVVWGDQETVFSGHAYARGGANSGNGGFVEVSTGDGVVFDGMVNTTAAKGKTGTLLIDPATVTIGNGPDTVSGTYLNAGNIADTMAFTYVTVLADQNIVISENVDFANSPNFGATIYDLTLQTSTIDLFHDIKMGAGKLNLLANTINLDGMLLNSSGGMLAASQYGGTAGTVNVLGNQASIQQAIGMSSTVSAPVINLAAGSYAENIQINKSLTLSGAGAESTALFGATGGGTILTLNAGNVNISGIGFDAMVDGGNLANSAHAIAGSGGGNISNNSFTGFTSDAVAFSLANNLSMSSNAFTNIGRDAIHIDGGNSVTLEGNIISADGASTFGAVRHGIYVADTTSLTLVNNEIRGENGATGAGDTGIYLSNVDGALVEGNLIEGLTAGIGASLRGIYLADSDNAIVRNNTVHSDDNENSVGSGEGFVFENNTNLIDENNQVVSDYVEPPPPPPPPPPGDDDPPTNPYILKLEKRIEKIEGVIGILEQKLETTTSWLLTKLYTLEIKKLEHTIERIEKRIERLEARGEDAHDGKHQGKGPDHEKVSLKHFQKIGSHARN